MLHLTNTDSFSTKFRRNVQPNTFTQVYNVKIYVKYTTAEKIQLKKAEFFLPALSMLRSGIRDR
jgi:hypothetical protein